LKATWFSHRDLGQLFDKCLRNAPEGFDIYWGVSGNDGMWVNNDHAREVIGYEPQDNGAEWDAPP